MVGAIVYYIHDHFLLFSIIFFGMGFLLGKVLNADRLVHTQKIDSFFTTQKKEESKKNHSIDIDTSTHVVKIKTDGMKKHYENIATEQTKQEDITSSVNKLKNLKK